MPTLPPRPTVTPPSSPPSAGLGSVSMPSPPAISGMDNEGGADPSSQIAEAFQDLIDAGCTISKNADGSYSVDGDIPDSVPTSGAGGESAPDMGGYEIGGNDGQMRA